MDATSFRKPKTQGLAMTCKDITEQGGRCVVVIDDVVEAFVRGRKKDQPKERVIRLVFMDGHSLILNNRNREALIARYGAETMNWTGKRIAVEVEHGNFGGNVTERKAIRFVDDDLAAELREAKRRIDESVEDIIGTGGDEG